MSSVAAGLVTPSNGIGGGHRDRLLRLQGVRRTRRGHTAVVRSEQDHNTLLLMADDPLDRVSSVNVRLFMGTP